VIKEPAYGVDVSVSTQDGNKSDLDIGNEMEKKRLRLQGISERKVKEARAAGNVTEESDESDMQA
jgi:hypothetical protein